MEQSQLPRELSSGRSQQLISERGHLQRGKPGFCTLCTESEYRGGAQSWGFNSELCILDFKYLLLLKFSKISYSFLKILLVGILPECIAVILTTGPSFQPRYLPFLTVRVCVSVCRYMHLSAGRHLRKPDREIPRSWSNKQL